MRTLLALLSGSGIAAWLGALLWPLAPEELVRSGVVLAGDLGVVGLTGNWAAALAVGVVLLLVPPHKRPPEGSAFWIGFAIGIPSLLALLGVTLPLALAGGLLAMLAAARVRSARPGARVASIGALGCAAAGFGFLVYAHTTAAPERWVSMDEGGGHRELLPVIEGVERDDPVPQGPDVVLLSLDTLRADAILPAGAASDAAEDRPTVGLPTLDRLRREGLWAEYALSSSNQTVPGHLGMLTGLDALRHGVRDNRSDVPPGLPNLATRFREAGWSTAAVIANQLLAPDMGFGEGFDRFDASTVRRDAPVHRFNAWIEDGTWFGWLLPRAVRDAALRRVCFLAPRLRPLARQALVEAGERRRGSVTTSQTLHMLWQLERSPRPYFLFVNYLDPHHPYGAPPPHRGSVAGDTPPPAGDYAPGDPEDPVRIAQIRAVERDLAEGKEEAQRAAEYFHRLYLENVAYNDALLRELVIHLQDNGRETVLLVTGDHGEHFGEHALMLHGNSMFEEQLRVPFVVWGANVAAGRVDHEVHLADVAPTLLSLAGLPHDDLPGIPATAAAGERVHAAMDEAQVALRHGAWKWIGRWSGSELIDEALYRLADDPREENNLLGSAETPPVLQAAIEAARERLRSSAEVGDVPEWKQARMNELGYADDEE